MGNVVLGLAAVAVVAIITFLVVRRFEDTIQPLYDGGMFLYNIARAVFFVITLLVFIMLGQWAAAVVLVILGMVWFYFDYYSPTPNPARSKY